MSETAGIPAATSGMLSKSKTFTWLQGLCGKPTELLLRFPYAAQCGLALFVAIYRGTYREGKKDIYISWMFQHNKYGISMLYGFMTLFAELQNCYWAFHAVQCKISERVKAQRKQQRQQQQQQQQQERRQSEPALTPSASLKPESPSERTAAFIDEEVAVKEEVARAFNASRFIAKHAIPAMLRWAFAIGRATVVTATFEYYTEGMNNFDAPVTTEGGGVAATPDERKQALHANCVNVLAVGAALQWFSCQQQSFDFSRPAGALSGVASFALPIVAFAAFKRYSDSVYFRQYPASGMTNVPGAPPPPTDFECAVSCMLETFSLSVSIPRPAGFV